MQTFLTSLAPFSSGKRPSTRGFTLTELLISIGIIGVVTGVVLTQYSAFDSTVLLKNEAYEIALLLRESQVRSVSVARNAEGTFDYPYGVTFTPGSQTYTSFTYASATEPYPYYDIPEPDPDFASIINSFTMERSMQVSDACVYGTALPDPCNVDRLDVSFRRPEFSALFYAVSGGSTYTNSVTSARIKLDSGTDSANVFVVEISKLGQISVYKE